MATYYWIGGADAVAQAATVEITAFDAATTYTLTAGDASASVAGNASANQTATDLAAAWEALTHAHATAVSANATAANITLAAVTAGTSFSVTTAVASGNGTIGNATETVANAGPCSAQTIANYIDGSTGAVATALPGGNDTLVFADSSVNVAFDLDALTGGPDLIQERTYTGKIGLPSNAFTTSADGDTATAGVREYREQYLRGPFGAVTLGRTSGIGSASSSGRIKINNTTAGASVNRVLSTAAAGTDTGKAAVRLITGNASAAVYIESAAAGVGIADDEPTDTATVGNVTVSDTTTTSKLVIGAGTTLGNLSVQGGTTRVKGAAATVTAITALGGTLYLAGDFTSTTTTIDGGTVYDSHVKTGGNATGTAVLRAGTLDLQVSGEPRTIDTLTHTGGTLKLTDAVTLTNRTDPPRSTVTAS